MIIPDEKDCKTLKCWYSTVNADNPQRAEGCEIGNSECIEYGISFCCFLCQKCPDMLKNCGVSDSVQLLMFKKKYSAAR